MTKPNRLLIYPFITLVVLSLFIVAARSIGARSDPSRLAMLSPGSCTQPCWHDIQPGKTSLEDAANILRNENIVKDARWPEYLYQLCWSSNTQPVWHGCVRRSSDHHTPVRSVELQPPTNAVRVGDLIRLFGEPTAARLCSFWMDMEPNIVALIYFPNNILVTAHSQHNESGLNPDMTVRWLYYYPAGAPLYGGRTPAWQGFNSTLKPYSCQD